MYSSILILLCIINVQPTDSSLHIPQYPVHSTFDCAVNIINSATDISVLIAHFHEENINHLLTKFRPNFTICNIRKNETTNYKLNLYKHDMYLIIIRVVEELNIVFKVLNLYPGGKIIVLNLGNNEKKVIFQTAWTKYIINICVIHISNGTCNIDTYFPYENSNCGKNISVTRLGRCQDLSLDAMFPNKVPLVLPGCAIRVVANIAVPFVMDATLPVEDSRKIGMEAAMLKNVLGRINLTQKLIAMTYSELSFIFSNGTFVGTYSYLAEGKCDLVYGQKWNAYFFSDYFDNTHSHYIESCNWHVPLALPGQQWTNILLAFDYTLWLSVLILLFCMILVTWLFSLVSTQTGRYSSLGLCSLNIWYILLMGSVQLPTVASLRILVYFWSIFALLLTTSYQSQLLGFLMKPVYEHQISTLDELLNSSLKIPLESNIILSLEKSDSPSDLEILKKGYVVTMEEIRDMWLYSPKDIALLGPTSLSKFVLWILQYYSDGKPRMYVFKHTFNSFKLTMHTVKGFPLLDRMDDIILRSMAAGFNAKWQRDIEPYRTPKENELRVLTTEDIRGAFFILAVGCLIALLSFITEILICKIKLK